MKMKAPTSAHSSALSLNYFFIFFQFCTMISSVFLHNQSNKFAGAPALHISNLLDVLI